MSRLELHSRFRAFESSLFIRREEISGDILRKATDARRMMKIRVSKYRHRCRRAHIPEATGNAASNWLVSGPIVGSEQVLVSTERTKQTNGSRGA
jgi:hypothetical protein